VGLPINLPGTQYCMDKVRSSVVAGWPRPTRYLNLLVVSVRLAINSRAPLRNITHNDKTFDGSLPHCMQRCMSGAFGLI